MGTPKEAYLRLSEDVRRKIEETAVALYAQHPYNAVTARLICRTLKINSATLYRWFDSKDDLYIYLMKTLLDRETFRKTWLGIWTILLFRKSGWVNAIRTMRENFWFPGSIFQKMCWQRWCLKAYFSMMRRFATTC